MVQNNLTEAMLVDQASELSIPNRSALLLSHCTTQSESHEITA